MNDPKQSSDSDGFGEDPMVDSLLAEVFGKSQPPDLSTTILRRLRETPIITRPTDAAARSSGATVVAGVSSQGTVKAASKRQSNRMYQAVLGMVAIAASLGLVIVAWNVYQPRSFDYSSVANTKNAAEPTPKKASVAVGEPSKATESPKPQPRPERPAPRGITIAREDANSNLVTEQADVLKPRAQHDRSKVDAVQRVSFRASEGITGYWNAVGVKPSDTANGEEVRSRLKARLFVDLDSSWLGLSASKGAADSNTSVAERIESALRSKANSNGVAFAWLGQMTGGAIQHLPEDQRQRLIAELASAFQGQQPLDLLIASWLRGDSENSSAWYTAMTRGSEFAMVHRLASLTMNVDLRCTRCHDALIESDGRQHDYWSFASVLRRDLARDENGRWNVRKNDSDTNTAPVFYERPDGRQTIAEPKIPTSWLVSEPSNNASTTSALQDIKSVRQWSDAIVGSQSFARGIVNSLWRLVHDRPLLGVVADASSAPLDDALVQLEDLLADDFVASNFDVSRLLSIILSSPATIRSIPETLVRQDAWALDSEKVRTAEQAVEAFAATAPSPKLLPLGKRVDISMRSIGATLKGVDSIGTVLAQPLGKESDGNDKLTRDTAPMSNGFPDHADELPVQWLASIDSFDSQVKHLGYLAVAESLPPGVEDAALAMQKASVPTQLTLHRVWWLLRP